MPLYEYECSECQQVTEALQKFSDRPLSKCPQCGGRLHKLMSRNAFHLKGAGWYVTDYHGKNSSTATSDSETSSATTCAPPVSAAAKPDNAAGATPTAAAE